TRTARPRAASRSIPSEASATVGRSTSAPTARPTSNVASPPRRRPHRARLQLLARRQPLLRVIVRLLRRRLGAVDHAAVDQLLLLRDRFEEEAVARDLRDHEVVLGDADLVERAEPHAIERPSAAA